MKPLVRVLAILGLTGALLSGIGPASAQQVCAPHDDASKRLENGFDERVVGRGLARSGKKMLEIFVSEKGSWTVMISDPNGRSCLLASGESWQEITPLIGDPA